MAGFKYSIFCMERVGVVHNVCYELCALVEHKN